MTATHTVKIRPAGASAWFYLRAGGWPRYVNGKYAPRLTTKREYAARFTRHVEDVAREIEAKCPGVAAKAVPGL